MVWAVAGPLSRVSATGSPCEGLYGDRAHLLLMQSARAHGPKLQSGKREIGGHHARGRRGNVRTPFSRMPIVDIWIGMRRDSEGRMKTRPRPGEDIGVAMGAAEGGTAPKLDPVERATPCTIEDEDFLAEFDCRKWEVEWYPKEDLPVLKNKVDCYTRTLREGVRECFDLEVERWIEEGILSPWEEPVEDGTLPLMAVVQPTKSKVRPVLDFRELNQFVKCPTGDDFVDVCSETLRRWRRRRGASAVVDLRAAYLQIHVTKKLWKYQQVKYKKRIYCLTRLGFGLSSAPRIMTRILKTVLEKTETMKKGTDSYLDDILVDDSVVSTSSVVEHLARYGLTAKEPKPLEGGAVLGLRLERNGAGTLMFRRGNEIPKVTDEMCKRELFSLCGKLVGHYPIAGWLRKITRVLHQQGKLININSKIIDLLADSVNSVIDKYNNLAHFTNSQLSQITDSQTALFFLHHLNELDKELDSLLEHTNIIQRDIWNAHAGSQGAVWCDASSIATGAVLEIGGVVVEDGAWQRKKDDYHHINMSELDAVIKGINLALKWGLREIEIRTDSATVAGWMNSVLTAEKRVRTKGAAEILVKRRLGILRELIDESFRAKELHKTHHLGVDRSLFLARKVDPNISKEEVRHAVRACARCQSIDPAPRPHSAGELCVEENWRRLAIDVTHYQGTRYLSMVDCGPGRFGIWRKLKAETGEESARVMKEVFLERGPVGEVLMDNGTVFRSKALKGTLDKWNTRRFFRAAYRPSGNGIVERHHRIIKSMAEMARILPTEAVFLYNMSPRSGQDDRSVPQKAVFKYDWLHPLKGPEPPANAEEGLASVQVGEEVWVSAYACEQRHECLILSVGFHNLAVLQL
ncbi:uncharacterized protein LOC143019828 [Oratosquilla oratoria]|uniref:uncharacterized protein LOC143019828 n=1 Tax=Oratosquilla oratoria TaxID=337810 RepID=UPI003F767987